VDEFLTLLGYTIARKHKAAWRTTAAIRHQERDVGTAEVKYFLNSFLRI